MTSVTRREILDKLAQISDLDPDIRFGQLIANLATMSGGPWDQTLWDLEDDQLLDALDQLVGMLSTRESAPMTMAIAG